MTQDHFVFTIEQKTFDGRNSFYKIDPDTTFMRMKENHMRNKQLKPSYNLKIATENQFFLHYDIYPNSTDTRTLLSFLEIYPHELKRVVADVWYSSEKNLLTLNRMEVEHLIKYNLFDKEQKKKYRESDRNLNNWTYDEGVDSYTQLEGWVYQFDYLKHNHTTTDFK